MGYFSSIDLEVREMIADGYTREQIARAFPILTKEDLDMYFEDDCDYSPEDDGQPTEAEEWADYMGGDDNFYEYSDNF